MLATTKSDQDSLTFLALALDSGGRPLGVANSDPATRLFLGEREGGVQLDAAQSAAALRDVRLFVRAYPVGLLIDRVGPVVANDAYATPPVWRAFDRDRYHSPYVVWGREVKLPGRVGEAAAAIPLRETGCRAERAMTEPQPLSAWRRMGVRTTAGMNGSRYPTNATASAASVATVESQ